MMRTMDAVGKRAKEIFPYAEASWFEAYGRVVGTGESMRFENYLAPLGVVFEIQSAKRSVNVAHRRFDRRHLGVKVVGRDHAV